MDSGYTGIKNIQSNARLPQKRRKGKRLTKEERKENRAIASERALNENIIGCLKRFKILSDKYRNRRKRFGLRLNLIAGIYNRDNVTLEAKSTMKTIERYNDGKRERTTPF